MPHPPGQHGDKHIRCVAFPKRPCGCVRRGSCRENVVHQQQSQPRQVALNRSCKCPPLLSPTNRWYRQGLPGSRTRFSQQLGSIRSLQATSQPITYGLRRGVDPPKAAPPIVRHRHHRIERFGQQIAEARVDQQIGERCHQRRSLTRLTRQDRLPQRAFISPQGYNPAKSKPFVPAIVATFGRVQVGADWCCTTPTTLSCGGSQLLFTRTAERPVAHAEALTTPQTSGGKEKIAQGRQHPLGASPETAPERGRGVVGGRPLRHSLIPSIVFRGHKLTYPNHLEFAL